MGGGDNGTVGHTDTQLTPLSNVTGTFQHLPVTDGRRIKVYNHHVKLVGNSIHIIFMKCLFSLLAI